MMSTIIRSWDRIARDREKFLVDEVGLLSSSMRYLKMTAPRLCDEQSVKRRIAHLRELGFTDPIALINYNPTLIMRKRKNVGEKVHLWDTWLKKHQLQESVHTLSFKYPQMYSVSIKKLRFMFAISDTVAENITASRMCNMITLNVDDVLCTYLWHDYRDFALLRLDVIRGVSPLTKLSKNKKRLVLIRRMNSLPKVIFGAYHSYIGTT
jgi:hypothetical protein